MPYKGSVKFSIAELGTNLGANSVSQMDRHEMHIQLTSFPTSKVPKSCPLA